MFRRLLFLIVGGLLSVAQLWAVTPKQEIAFSFDFNKRFKLATNQFAVWIENSNGEFVKTIFVTAFTAGKGWSKRPDALIAWRKAVKEKPVDGISGATPKSGRFETIWDMTDAQGNEITDGSYKLRFEANTAWKTYLEYECTISVKGNEVLLKETPPEMIGEAPLKQKMVANIKTEVRKSGKANKILQCL